MVEAMNDSQRVFHVEEAQGRVAAAGIPKPHTAVRVAARENALVAGTPGNGEDGPGRGGEALRRRARA